ncbi:hypothetical protein E6O75_ATG08330 [Venturia nashicola]|uniref:Uncharacterized protein n=1 Tax=Venturia nashicola TaxID=86259 RepID=A0A4Z1NVJ9_9PEZI|nr:hypothetical protein E6O75_ATG08330 [Venturia nashicola]
MSRSHQSLEGEEAKPVPPPEYEFLRFGGNGSKSADVVSRKLIRSHVMRNYFQEKNKKSSSNDSSATSAGTVNSRDKLKGRWRLGAAEVADGRPPAPRRKSSTKTTTSSSSGGTSRRSSQQVVPVLEDTAEELWNRYNPINDRSSKSNHPMPFQSVPLGPAPTGFCISVSFVSGYCWDGQGGCIFIANDVWIHILSTSTHSR